MIAEALELKVKKMEEECFKSGRSSISTKHCCYLFYDLESPFWKEWDKNKQRPISIDANDGTRYCVQVPFDYGTVYAPIKGDTIKEMLPNLIIYQNKCLKEEIIRLKRDISICECRLNEGKGILGYYKSLAQLEEAMKDNIESEPVQEETDR